MQYDIHIYIYIYVVRRQRVKKARAYSVRSQDTGNTSSRNGCELSYWCRFGGRKGGFLYRICPKKKFEFHLIFKHRLISFRSAFKIVPLSCVITWPNCTSTFRLCVTYPCCFYPPYTLTVNNI